MTNSIANFLLLSCAILQVKGYVVDKSVAARFTCPAADGFYPADPNVCQADYYACLSGVAYPQTCPGVNFVFDPATNRCTSFDTSSCRGLGSTSGVLTTTIATPSTTTTSTTTTTPGSPTTSTTVTTTSTGPTVTNPGTYKCPAPDGFFPIPNFCTGDYYVCVSGSPYINTCPNNAIFDPVTSICTPADQASCRTPVTTTQRPFTCPANSGQYPYPGSCTLYYVCSAGNYIIAQCPAGKAFNPSIQYCDDPVNVPGCGAYSFIQFYEESKLVGITGSSSTLF